MKSPVALVLAGLVPGLLAGLALGLLLRDPPEPGPAPSQVRHRPAGPAAPKDGAVDAAPPAAPTPGAVAPQAKPVSEVGAPRPDRGEALRRLHEELRAIAEEDPEAAAELALSAFADDPLLADEAASKLAATADLAELDRMAALLATSRRPAVEAAAVDLALHDSDPQRRAVGLRLLGQLGTPRAIPAVQEVLTTSTDPTVVGAAIHALPRPSGIGQADAARLESSLTSIAGSSPDPELRRRALVALGSWSRDPAPLLGGLRDPDPAVRAGAAFGLERAGGGGAAGLAALAERLADEDEDSLVRENAWRALGASGPLPEPILEIWREAGRRLEGRELDD